jgi:signal transduction histidine kinase
MQILMLVFLVVYTFGAVAFAALSLLCVKQCGRGGWEQADRVHFVMEVLCTVWFVMNLSITLKELYGTGAVWWAYALVMGVAAIFPPLMSHAFYCEEAAFLPRTSFWAWWLRGGYGLAAVLIVGALLALLGVPRTSLATIFQLLSAFLFASFLAAVLFAQLVRRRSARRIKTPEERRYHRWNVTLLIITVLLFVLVSISVGSAQSFGQVVGLFSRALPLCFMFVGTYYRNRFEFFDVFVKQGTFFLVTLVSLTLFFALVTPNLDSYRLGWGRPWVYAVIVLPVVLVSPWAYRHLGHWLDRAWLGRNFSTVEAVKFFLEGIRDAASEEDLAAKAQVRLTTILQAPVGVMLAPSDGEAGGRVSFEVVLRVPLTSQGLNVGCMCLGKRVNDAPYFSEDAVLLSSLADVFSSVLTGVRLQLKRQEQEKREQELVLNASRSELKALRAQINPHFLFNALNVIAGLIGSHPARAEETVERLADVFRYTLRRSEKEWVRLADEIEFIESYLEIEKARFGDRLQVSVEIGENARDCNIPSMIIQTLVENAVKHGVAAVRGAGVVKVQAHCVNDRLRIEVVDNGPGFSPEVGETSRPTGRQSAGYGLRNVRQRLEGYFGAEGSLEIRRREDQGLTEVAVEFPAPRVT